MELKRHKNSHSPTLDTVIMVEETIKRIGACSITELYRALPRTVIYPTLKLIIEYFYTKGGCGTSGIRIKSDRNETSLTCKIVHSCDPGDSCMTSQKKSIILTAGETATLSCCYSRTGTCTYSPDNCRWDGWDKDRLGIKYVATYSNYGIENPTTTTTVPVTTTTTTIPNCQEEKVCRRRSIHGICLSWYTKLVCSETTTTIPGCLTSGSTCESDEDCCSNDCQSIRECRNKSIHGICLTWQIKNICA